MRNWGCNSDSLSHHNKFVWEYYGRDKKIYGISSITSTHFSFFSRLKTWNIQRKKENTEIESTKIHEFILDFFTISFREETHREEIKGGDWLSRGGMKDVEAPDLCCFLTKGPYSTILYHHIQIFIIIIIIILYYLLGGD